MMTTSTLLPPKLDFRRQQESSDSELLPWDAAGIQNEWVRRSIELASMASGKISSDACDQIDLRTLALGCRGGIIALTLIGMSGMALVSLLQMGLLRRFLDLPIRRSRILKKVMP
jgi:hypothetical protein